MSTATRRNGKGRKGGGKRSPQARRAAAAIDQKIAAQRAGRRPAARRRGWGAGPKAAVAVGVGLLVLAVLFLANRRPGGSDEAGAYRFDVGAPGPGEQAPPLALPATDGSTFDLADHRGETVLLYFQEGLMCQPCWDQLVEIEAGIDGFDRLGIDRIVSITHDPIDALEQKATDEGLSTPILSDPDLFVSHSYDTTSYGMMGGSTNGHTFIAVGPDGRILWRADYGGAPDFTMFVPVSNLLADLRRGLRAPG